jgi:hypothetical protein
LVVEIAIGVLLAVIFFNPVVNWMCRKWYGRPAVKHIEVSSTKIRPGDNVRLTPITDVPCGGETHPQWRTTHGVISPEGPAFTLSTQGVREQVPFSVYVSLVIEDKCENQSTEYRVPAPIIVDGPPRPRVTSVVPDPSQVWRGDPVVLTAEADQPDVRYEWNIPNASIVGAEDRSRVRIDTSGIRILVNFVPITGTCTAISSEGGRSDPKDFSFWVWQKISSPARGRRSGGTGSRTKLIVTPQGAPPPAGANVNPAPAQAPPPPNPGGTGGATQPQPPAPAAKPSP